ncbi:MAG: hypothetical protein LRS49_00365, partial [Desulfurococcales archaeon]|nr:hypothetical protein [Desulfurococcales archaeon]
AALLSLVEEAPPGLHIAAASHPAANSTASLAEARYELIRSGVPPVPLGPLGVGDPGTLERLGSTLRGLAAAAVVSGSRLGVVGEPPAWVVHDASQLARSLGVALARIPAGELLSRLPREPPPPPRGLLGAALRVSPDPAALRDALRVYHALRELASDYALDAVAPSCPSFMGEAGSNACLAMALLNVEGLTVGCEGDVAATLALHLSQAAAGRPGFLANTAWIRGGRLLAAHCGAPPTMGVAHSVESHVLTRRSPTLAVWFPRGVGVTVAQAGWAGDVLVVGEGVVAEGAPWRGRQCESQMLVEIPGEAGLAQALANLRTGNHVAVTLGRHAMALSVAWAALNPGAPVVVAGGEPWL